MRPVVAALQYGVAFSASRFISCASGRHVHVHAPPGRAHAPGRHHGTLLKVRFVPACLLGVPSPSAAAANTYASHMRLFGDGAAYRQAHTGGTRGSLPLATTRCWFCFWSASSLWKLEAEARSQPARARQKPKGAAAPAAAVVALVVVVGGGGGVGGCKPGSDTAGHSANCQIPFSLPPNRPPHFVPRSAEVLQHQRDRTTGITGNARTCFPVDLQPPLSCLGTPFPSPPPAVACRNICIK